MQFILIAHDKEGGLALRLETRPAHLQYWQVDIGEALLYGGPLLGADGKPNGSVLIVQAADAQAAQAVFEADPYMKAGLFEAASINGFRHVFSHGKVVG